MLCEWNIYVFTYHKCINWLLAYQEDEEVEKEVEVAQPVAENTENYDDVSIDLSNILITYKINYCDVT